MRISNDTLKGYILEEVLAYLIRKTGYKLLVDPVQDPRDLGWDHGRFVVKGRGGVHQVDVLGQLVWIPAFTYPLRLFVEAKFRREKTGIGAVRNAIGVLLDINQNNSPTREQKVLPQKYQYVYALFSTSGFSIPATEMALAHQISLIDLSGDEFINLRSMVTKAADLIVGQRDYELDETDIQDRREFVSNVRNSLRRQLGTLPEGIQYQGDRTLQFRDAIEPVISMAREYDELFVAMANGPFMLSMKADAPQAFLDYAKEHPRHRVIITWSRRIDNGRTWEITPVKNKNAYRLSFRLPEILSHWVFGASKGVNNRALQAKQDYLSNITIYRHIEGQDFLVRLEFDLESTRRHIGEVNR